MLNKVSCPTQEFDIDVENFIFIKAFEHWSEQLETGCLINVELDTNDVALLFLSNITVNYDDHSLSMTFGNRFNKFDTKSLFDDVLGNISKSANTLNYVRDILYPIKNGKLNTMQEALDTSRNLTMKDALSSSDEEVIIDGAGYTGKRKLEDGTYDPHQVKIVGKKIVFTDDAWETCKVAVGEILLGDNQVIYGVNAQAIIGDIIIGNELRILDSDGNDIFSVIEGKISMKASKTEVTDAINQIELTPGPPGASGAPGEDAVTLRIDSSRGTVFKNNTISTVLTVTIFKGPNRIENLAALRAEFGATAHLEWQWLRLDEDRYGVISATDPMISNDGFVLTLTADRVDTKVTFRCNLII